MVEPSPLLASIAKAQTDGLSPAAIDERVWQLHGTTCAMLALDSSGMTRVTRSHGIVHFLVSYAQMVERAALILARHGCLGWRSFADNLFAEFPHPDMALAAALELQHSLSSSPIPLNEEENYCVSIGIAYGRVLQDGSAGVMGDQMNLAAKLAEEIAQNGQILFTEAAHAVLSARSSLPLTPAHTLISQVDILYYRLQLSQ